MKEFFKNAIRSFLLPFSIITRNDILFEQLVFGYQTPTIHNDLSTFEQELQKLEERLKDDLGVDLNLPKLDYLMSLCGTQHIPSDNGLGQIYVMEYKNLNAEPDESGNIPSISLVVNSHPIECSAYSFDPFEDIVETLIESLEVKEVKEVSFENTQLLEVTEDSSGYLNFDWDNSEDVDKFLGCEVNKLSSDIAFITRRGAGNVVVISEEDSIFEGCLYVNNFMARGLVCKSSHLKPNELLMGYRGTSEIDCGAIFSPTKIKKDDAYKIGLYFRPEFFRLLRVN